MINSRQMSELGQKKLSPRPGWLFRLLPESEFIPEY